MPFLYEPLPSNKIDSILFVSKCARNENNCSYWSCGRYNGYFSCNRMRIPVQRFPSSSLEQTNPQKKTYFVNFHLNTSCSSQTAHLKWHRGSKLFCWLVSWSLTAWAYLEGDRNKSAGYIIVQTRPPSTLPEPLRWRPFIPLCGKRSVMKTLGDGQRPPRRDLIWQALHTASHKKPS